MPPSNGGRGMSNLFFGRFSTEFQPKLAPSRHFTHTLASLIPGCSETRFLGSRPRPRLCFFESQWRDETETFFLLSLNIETRPRLFFSESQCRDETETFFLLSLNVETRPRLFFSESQYRDETETLFLLRIDHFVVIQFEIDHIYS